MVVSDYMDESTPKASSRMVSRSGRSFKATAIVILLPAR